MHVLIIGRSTDGHVELVAKHLSVPYTIIDTNSIRDGAALSYRTRTGNKPSILYQGVELRDVTAVWCKKLQIEYHDAKYRIDKNYQEYAKKVLSDFIGGLTVSFEDAFWISSYQAMLRVYNKQYHLPIADQLGFAVPDTLMTSDPIAARAFIDSHESTIVKPFSPRIFTRPAGGGNYFFAAKVKKAESLDMRTLPIAPVIFQEAIDQECDIRVTVVGKKVFAASIKGKESEKDKNRDWRMSQFDGSMVVTAHELPASIAAKCIRLVKRMGLEFGAVDLLLDKSGKYWFLEINTTGAWRFIEDRTHQPIAAEISYMLETKGKNR